MSPAGYSGTPLHKKLGIKPGFRVKTRSAPADYLDLVRGVPEDASISSRLRGRVDLLHLFVSKRRDLERGLEAGMDQIERDGMIWVSWPKKSSGVPSQVTEDTIREVALPMGLVDVKVCAVDETWSGLKLVIRKELR